MHCLYRWTKMVVLNGPRCSTLLTQSSRYLPIRWKIHVTVSKVHATVSKVHTTVSWKLGIYSRSMQWWFQHLKLFTKTSIQAANKNSGYTSTKMDSRTCSVPLSNDYCLTTTSHAIHRLTYCAMRHGITLFFKAGPWSFKVLWNWQCYFYCLDTRAHTVTQPKGAVGDA